MQLKTCSVCNQEFQIDNFYKSKYSRDGHRSECKDCSKSNNKRYYESHRQQVLDSVALYTEDNKDKIKQYQRGYRQEKNYQAP